MGTWPVVPRGVEACLAKLGGLPATPHSSPGAEGRDLEVAEKRLSLSCFVQAMSPRQ